MKEASGYSISDLQKRIREISEGYDESKYVYLILYEDGSGHLERRISSVCDEGLKIETFIFFRFSHVQTLFETCLDDILTTINSSNEIETFVL